MSLRRKTYLGHDNDVLPRDVVFFKCLPKDTLRLSVRIDISRVEGVDAIVVPVSEGEKCK